MTDVRTEHRWSAETAGLVAGAWHQGVGCKHPDTCPNVSRPTAAERAAAEVVLDALRDRGLLLLEGTEPVSRLRSGDPEGGETRVRFMVQTSGTCWPCDTEAAAWAQFARVKAWPEKPAVSLLRQSVTEWTDGRAHFGPWEPVHAGT